jgi:hypothetical protein
MTKYFTSINSLKHKREGEIIEDNRFLSDGVNYNFEYDWQSVNVLALRINNINFLIDVSENEEENLLEIGGPRFKL